MSKLRLAWIVLAKELRDGIRDRRSIMSVLIGATIPPGDAVGVNSNTVPLLARSAAYCRRPVEHAAASYADVCLGLIFLVLSSTLRSFL